MKHETPDTFFSGHIEGADAFRAFMNHCIRLGISDIFVTVGETARGRLHGRLVPLTRWTFQMEQVADMLQVIAGSDEIRTSLAARRDHDAAFGIPDEEQTDEFGVPINHRFRLNATAIYTLSGEGAQIVMRHIPADPPTLAQVGFPDELMDEFAVKQGAVLIAGETGSGKTTTFAACIRHILENETAIKGNLVTFEQPVEFLFSGIKSDHSIIPQSEIGKHMESFADGVRNAMRRKPGLIVIGEMRDHETIVGAIEAANTGHPVFGTIHASDASLILQRMVQRFPTFAQQQAYADCVNICKLLISQTLVPRVGGGLVCLRDWVILDRERQEELISVGYERHAAIVRAWMKRRDRASSMGYAVHAAFEAGEISQHDRDLNLKTYGG